MKRLILLNCALIVVGGVGAYIATKLKDRQRLRDADRLMLEFAREKYSLEQIQWHASQAVQ